MTDTQKKTSTKAEKTPTGLHVVQEGENLLDIANQYSVSVDSLKVLNGLQTGFSNPPAGTTIRVYPEAASD